MMTNNKQIIIRENPFEKGRNLESEIQENLKTLNYE